MEDLNSLTEQDERIMKVLMDEDCDHVFRQVKRYKFKGKVFIVWRCSGCAIRTVAVKPGL